MMINDYELIIRMGTVVEYRYWLLGPRQYNYFTCSSWGVSSRWKSHEPLRQAETPNDELWSMPAVRSTPISTGWLMVNSGFFMLIHSCVSIPIYFVLPFNMVTISAQFSGQLMVSWSLTNNHQAQSRVGNVHPSDG